MLARSFLSALLIGALGLSGTAVAQRAPTPKASATAAAKAPQLTPEQIAALRKQNQVLVNYAAAIVGMVDRGQIAQVWDASSQVCKQTTPKDRFVKSTEADRTQLGSVTERKVQEITRGLSDGSKSPRGYYVNINFATKFSKFAKPVRELVSFHLDQDRTWRLSGYTVH